MTDTPLLEARKLGKQVSGPEGELTLLEDINFTLLPGQSLAITGPSGSGKSTLLGLLAGLDSPTSGEVLINGRTFSDLSEDQRAQQRGELCSFVFQDFHLVNDLNALENVMLPLELKGVVERKEIALHWLEQVGLNERIKHFPTTLSGGEQQRVALARAFAVQPGLLFADEPTGSLDHANGSRVIELLFELNKNISTTAQTTTHATSHPVSNTSHGAALILVTHDATLAERCDYHLRLQAGRIYQVSTDGQQSEVTA
ncbi:MAG: ABC transporter ATP-binding protein [Porticoccaceae bacterium]|nr:ABC transporter ATP-binding protein [Porticoccaceae bacterium]